MNKSTDQRVERLQIAVEKRVSEIRNRIKGKFVTLPRGKFKGRRGQIESVIFGHGNRVCALVRPFRLDNPTEFVDFSHPDARTYWPYEELIFCE